MTLDYFQNDKSLKSAAAELRGSPLGAAIVSVFNSELLRLSAMGGTKGSPEADKIEHGGIVQGFNQAIVVLASIFSEPRPSVRDVASNYGAPGVIQKREKK